MRKYEFSKTKSFDKWKEQDILTHVRFYLLGYFQKIKSEVQTEFAIRRPVTHATDIAFNKNCTEILKLMRRKKRLPNLKYGVLVLLDFSGKCLKNEHFEAYRCSTDLLSGNYKKDNFSILYVHIDENNQSKCIRKEIRV